jgi:hypothetical protein
MNKCHSTMAKQIVQAPIYEKALYPTAPAQRSAHEYELLPAVASTAAASTESLTFERGHQ